MTAFFSGTDERQVFCNLTIGKGDSSNALVVLCYPFGQEYMRSHRAFRQLTNLLNRAGFDVLRFDYPGAGDSYGLAENVDFNSYVEAGQAAIEQLVGEKGYRKLVLIGLRLGAFVAAQLARLFPQTAQLLLWDPLLDGKRFLENIQPYSMPSPIAEAAVHGYPINQDFRQQLQSLSLADLLDGAGYSCEQVVSELSSDAQALAELGVETFHEPCFGDWNYVDMQGSILLPTALIKTLCQRVRAQQQ